MSLPRRNGPDHGSSRNLRRPRVAGQRRRTTSNSESPETSVSEETVETASPTDSTVEPEVRATGAPEPEEAGSTATATDVGTGTEPEAPETTTVAAEEPPGRSNRGDASAGQPDSAEPPERDDRPSSALRRPAVLITAMLVLAAVCAGLAGWSGTEAHALRNEGSAANRALVDRAATSRVKGQVTDGVEKLFSYDYANTAKTRRAVDRYLTGAAVQQYEDLFALVKKQAPKQKLVLTTTVRTAGVTLLQDDRAEVLLFVDQDATRTDTGRRNVAPAQLSVTAEKHGDQWKIDNITQK